MLFGKLEKNDIFAIIRGTPPLDLNDFEIASDDQRAEIVHTPTESIWETNKISQFDYYTVYRVGDGPERESRGDDFTHLKAQVSFWALEIRNYVESPDLWDELRKGSDFVRGLGEGDDNRRFDDGEKNALADELRRVAAEVRQLYQLSADQSHALGVKVDYVIEALDRTGRNDWSIMVVGAVMSYLLTVGLSSEQARSLFELFMTAIARFYGHEYPKLLTM